MASTAGKPASAEPLLLRLRGGLQIATPASIESYTTYILLEQEEWFEKEIAMVRRFLSPGMFAIDIGANHGVYSLLMAQQVGPAGRVIAFEPGTGARSLLERSRRLNKFEQLVIRAEALSDSRRDGRLGSSGSSEMFALQPDDADGGEPVAITSLDLEMQDQKWPAVDFVKIDAEGEEERILAGGAKFFAEQSPLVMFEVKAGETINEALRTRFRAMGYELFRQLGAEPILVPDLPGSAIDGFELNLFAAKSDRIEMLARQSMLVKSLQPWRPSAADMQIVATTATPGLWLGRAAVGSVDGEHVEGLASYAVWRMQDRPVAERCNALVHALACIGRTAARTGRPEHRASLVRAAFDFGARSLALGNLKALLAEFEGSSRQLGDPFLSPNVKMDDVDPSLGIEAWLALAAADQFERTIEFSSAFKGVSRYSEWLCAQPKVTTEVIRRRTLTEAMAGRKPIVPDRLRKTAPDHLNAGLWKAGLVPGTRL